MNQLISNTNWIVKIKEVKEKPKEEEVKISFRDQVTQKLISIYQKNKQCQMIDILTRILKNYQGDKMKRNIKKSLFKSNEEIELLKFMGFEENENFVLINDEKLSDYHVKLVIQLFEDIEKKIDDLTKEFKKEEPKIELKTIVGKEVKIDEKIKKEDVKEKDVKPKLKEGEKVEIKKEEKDSYKSNIIACIKQIQMKSSNWAQILKIISLIFENFEFKDSISRSFSLSSSFSKELMGPETLNFLEYLGYQRDRNFMKFKCNITLNEIIIIRECLDKFTKNEKITLNQSIIKSISYKKIKENFSYGFFK